MTPEDRATQEATGQVGEGAEYDTVRAAVRDLLPLFNPGGKPGGNWGCGLIEILEAAEDGHRAAIVFPIVSAWKQESNAITRIVDLGMIRATGIALLAYAESQEARP